MEKTFREPLFFQFKKKNEKKKNTGESPRSAFAPVSDFLSRIFSASQKKAFSPRRDFFACFFFFSGPALFTREVLEVTFLWIAVRRSGAPLGIPRFGMELSSWDGLVAGALAL